MAANDLFTSAQLRKLLDYDPTTGALTWFARTPDMFANGVQSAAHVCARWNSKHAGKPAFTRTSAEGYRRGAVMGRQMYAHRVIFAMQTGDWPKQIDHINGNRSDNRLANLRATTNLLNAQNQKRPKSNSSGVIGVSWAKQKRKWMAYINDCGRKKNLGYFATIEAATAARQAAQSACDFHPNHGRVGE